ncbi:MAG: molybdate transport system ATP-binding protein [Gammaproteobacteria bacterium]|jgi:molybdate transport system ATP-binding protein|nr:molybdate transport system ATP-binding protein [Gammaproteobacteria bacterium]
MRARLAVSLCGVDVRRGNRRVLHDISWQLLPGQRWALIGSNGAGKTQLLKLLSGEVWPVPGAGNLSYHLNGREVDLIEAKSRIAYIGGERQDKYARYGWNLRVRDLVTTGLHGTDLLLRAASPSEAKRVASSLRAAGLTRLAAREFLSLSYGEKRLALLARALVQDPDWLLLDEFYNGLDAHYRQRIDAVLSAARRRGQAWVATAHRAMDIPAGTSSLLELADGEIRALQRLRRHDATRLSRAAAEQSPKARRLPSKLRRAGRQRELLLELRAVDLFVEYRAVLQDVNWQLRRGEHWAVYGANGAGKSSFLKLLYGDLFPALGGAIERIGFPKGTPIVDWKRQVGLVSPELQSTYAIDVTLLELVASGRHSSIGLVDAPSAADVRIARRWLKFFKLLTMAKRRPRELSYGQLRRALIARAMAAEPRILLLDEPLTGLDPEQRALMKRLLQQLMRRRVSIIAAVHHPEDLPHGMTHALHLHKRQARSDSAT